MAAWAWALLLALPGAVLGSGGTRALGRGGRPRRLGAERSCTAAKHCRVKWQYQCNDSLLEDFAATLPAGLRSLSLDLAQSRAGDQGLAALARKLPQRLLGLDLRLDRTSATGYGLDLLTRAMPSTLKLLRLTLSGLPVGDSLLSLLSRQLPDTMLNLTLGLFQTGVTDLGFRTLGGFRLPVGLQSLTLLLEETAVTDLAMGALAQSLRGGLRSLTLSVSSHVTDRGLWSLAAHMPRGLSRLALSAPGAGVTDAGLGALAGRLPPKARQVSLGLEGTGLRGRGLGQLARHLPRTLRRLVLKLGNTHVGDKSLEGLRQHLPDSLHYLVLGLNSSMVSRDGVRSFCSHLPPGLRVLDLEYPLGPSVPPDVHPSPDLEHPLDARVEQPPGPAEEDLWPRLSAAVRAGSRVCVNVLAAHDPNVQDPFTGKTALMLAAENQHESLISELVHLGADTLTRDHAGMSARDYAASSVCPQLARLIPPATPRQTFEHIALQPKLWLAAGACLVAAVVACLPWGVEAASEGPAGLPRGAVKLAAKASHRKATQLSARMFRLLEVLANLVAVTSLLHRMAPLISVPLCCVLYGLPRLLPSRRDDLSAPLALEFAASRASMLDVGRWHRSDGCGIAFAVVRLCLLLSLVQLADSERLRPPGWMLCQTGREALGMVRSNLRRDLCVRGAAPVLKAVGWRPWGAESGLCEVEPGGCVQVSEDKGQCVLSTSILSSAVEEVAVPGSFGVKVNDHLYVDPNGLEGVVPFGEWKVKWHDRGGLICPRSNACVKTPTVQWFWHSLAYPCTFLVAFWALAAAGLAVTVSTPRCHGRLRAAASPTEVLALARQIEAAKSAKEVGRLRGAVAAVLPARAVVFVPPGGVYLTLSFIFADLFLDGYTVYTMLCNEDIYFAGVLLSTAIFSTLREVRSGSLAALSGEVAETLRTGVPTDGYQEVLDHERGSEALVSLLVSSYALPFTIKTPLQAVLCPLSVLFSAIGLSTFLYEALDLMEPGPGAEEDSEDSESATKKLSWAYHCDSTSSSTETE